MILSFSILESLEKESKDKDEKISKIKLVAVKAKKELDSNRKEVKQHKSTRLLNPMLWKIRYFYIYEKHSLYLQQAQTLREELESLRSEKDRLSASLKEFIQGAESYKVNTVALTAGRVHNQQVC